MEDATKERKKPGPKPKRPERVPMGQGLSLDIPGLDKENYHYRWFQDKDGRLKTAQSAWYDFAKNSAGENYVVHKGPHAMYLMRIEKKYYEEDKALKLQASKDKLSAEAQTLSPGEYVSGGKHHVLQQDEYDPLA